MVGPVRLELTTNGLGNRCSIHLSYGPGAKDGGLYARADSQERYRSGVSIGPSGKETES